MSINITAIKTILSKSISMLLEYCADLWLQSAWRRHESTERTGPRVEVLNVWRVSKHTAIVATVFCKVQLFSLCLLLCFLESSLIRTTPLYEATSGEKRWQTGSTDNININKNRTSYMQYN